MAMLDDVKMSLRITTSAYDMELTNLIEAAKIDMAESGVVADNTDPLVSLAIICFVKGNFGSNQDSEKYMRSYASILSKLRYLSNYTEDNADA